MLGLDISWPVFSCETYKSSVEEVAGVEKGSFENYKLSMQDGEAYTVYNARDKALQSIHDYLCMLDPRNVDSIADFVDRIQTTIYNLTDFDMEEYFEDKDDPRMHLRLNGFNRPVVFIVEYTFLQLSTIFKV